METTSEQSVLERYSKGAQAREAELCCPVTYDSKYLKALPQEIIEKDYGCGDPTPYLREGDTVLDLGSGGGKVCYIAAQKVGASGRVIGVDMTDDMLALARKYQTPMAEKFGYANVDFHKGKIQDLALNLAEVDGYLSEHPVKTSRDIAELEAFIEQQKRERPLIKDDSVDCVVSNCVLNLVQEDQKAAMFREIFRVVKRGGRVAISDIVADEPATAEMKADPVLWSGCISGAMTEKGFLKAFTDAGFYGVEIAKRDEKPWQTVQGIEFRSVVVTAYKGKEGACWDHHQAVIYRGPFSQAQDDDGHTYLRGERMAVCKKTFDILKRSPYAESFYFIEPYNAVAADDAKAFDCNTPAIRSARVTKGESYQATTDASDCCEPSPTACC